MPDAAPPSETMRRRGRPGHDREAVLRQAIDLFNRRGYDATSISELALQLGVTKSAIYHHFDSKEALLAAALDEALDGLSTAVSAAAEATGESAYARLRATVEAAVHILTAHLPAVTLLLRVRGNSPLERAALERRREIDERLATLVRDAAADGDLRRDVDPEVTSRLIFGLVNSLVDWYRPEGRLPEERLAETISSVLFTGLERPATEGERR
ncbi:TetR/AcrR family transcriptional regulator [Nocardioides limicola]|uniref:TetR/AcrR family transcriptional regulator n=1 Tax=Nocardioides limicola TaxID=2803368 RepID=UPI001EEFCCBB|nr:TetR/AcrR family transcriptional regulator [Nocardioides sp. DJM-14]